MSGLRVRLRIGCQAFALAVLPCVADAHSFGRLYNLPVPFWLYAWGAAGTLLLSFLLIAWFATRQSVAPGLRMRDLGEPACLRALRVPALLKGMSLLSLLLCIVTGLFGTRDPYFNFNTTFFWIVFALGFTYLTALCGDLYARLNPWKLMIEMLGQHLQDSFRGRYRYPQALGYWPALAFYAAFIWIELFAQIQPRSLALALLVYSALNLVGAWLVGSASWFSYCEFFGVFLRLVAKVAPLEYLPARLPGASGSLRLRLPFTGLLQEHAESLSEVVFLLFMLSSTAFDGLRETAPWKRLLWSELYRSLLPWLGGNVVQAYPVLKSINLACETLALLASPFLYFAAYLACIALARRLGGGTATLRELSLHFAYSLLPIALVYNITHYYTLIITQGIQILRLVSDPFGWNWNLFGTARWLTRPIIPDVGVVWHVQVGLILFGHIVSVYLAHLQALTAFHDRRTASLSQLPMLGLMVLFTVAGLWILAQPITGTIVPG